MARARARTRGQRTTAASTSSAPPARLPRVAKGRRAQFFDDPAIDQLFAIVTALTAEVSVVADRLASLEKVLERGRMIEAAAVERYVPDESETRSRTAAREALIERVFQVLEAYAPGGRPEGRGG